MITTSKRSLQAAAALAALLALTGCNATSGLLGGGGVQKQQQAINPEHRARELRLAVAARSTGQFGAAQNIYQRLLQADPTSAEVRTALADSFFEQAAYEQAIASYNEALASPNMTDSVMASALIGRGRTLLAAGRPETASADFDAARQISPNNPIALNGSAVAADMQGRHDAAQRLYIQALTFDPGNERVRSNLGLSYALSARFNDAVAELAPLTKVGERAPKARHNLALAFGLMGQPEQAQRIVAEDMNPEAARVNGLFYEAMRGAVNPDGTAYMAPPPAAMAPADRTVEQVEEREPAAAPAPKPKQRPVAQAAPAKAPSRTAEAAPAPVEPPPITLAAPVSKPRPVRPTAEPAPTAALAPAAASVDDGKPAFGPWVTLPPLPPLAPQADEALSARAVSN